MTHLLVHLALSEIRKDYGFGGSQLTSLSRAFRSGDNITSFSGNIDTSNVGNFNKSFTCATSLTTMPYFDASG